MGKIFDEVSAELEANNARRRKLAFRLGLIKILGVFLLMVLAVVVGIAIVG